MNTLERLYLKDNHFNFDETSGKHVSVVMENGSFALPENGFHDGRQLAIIKAQFGDELDRLQDMSIEVEPLNGVEFDVCLKWGFQNDMHGHMSQISGEDLYSLVSQAIVLACEEDV